MIKPTFFFQKISPLISCFFLLFIIFLFPSSISANIGLNQSWAKNEAEKLYKKASENILEEKKIRLYKRAIKIFPTHYKSLFRLGWYAQKMNLRQVAASFYIRCININKKHYSAYNNLANIYKDWKDFKKAIHYYKKALIAKPSYSVAPYNLGNLYKQRKEYQKAQEFYKLALKYRPNYYAANMNISYLYMNLAKTNSESVKKDTYYRKAENHLLKAKITRPEIVHIYTKLAVIYEHFHETKKAISVFRKIIALSNKKSKWYLYSKKKIKLLKKYKSSTG